MDDVHIIWHRRDLRVHDNKALFEASKDLKNTVLPVFIIDPFFFSEDRLDSDDRILFMFECLEDLKKNYRILGIHMHIYFGDSVEIISKLQKKYQAKVHYNFDSSMLYGYSRDNKVKLNKNFIGYQNDALVRDGPSRVGWAKQAQDYFDDNIYTLDKTKIYKGVIQEKQIKLEKVAQKYNLKKKQSYPLKGGESVALTHLDEFISKHISLYSRSISKPELSKLNCSRLSAHYSLGALSPKYAYQRVMSSNHTKKTKEFYVTRLFWREHFTQKLEDYPHAQQKAINPICNIEREKNQKYIDAFFKAQTGFPIIDAALRCLIGTGWLNFRSRAMLASFYSLILRQHWKDGADFMHRHLVDGDIAINYQQWQMQSALVGVHPLRIYNPRKMIEEHDSQGIFIKKHLEVFRDVKEVEYLCEPQKYTYQLKSQYGIILGEDYPKPIVNFEKEAKETRALVKEKLEEIRASLNDPNFLKKASFSKLRKFRRSQRKEKAKKKREEVKNDTSQKSLGDFL